MGFKKDYTANLYSLYRERAKLFRQTLLGLNLFAVAFFLFIAVPYYSAMRGNATLANRITTLREEIPKIKKTIDQLALALNGAAELEIRMQNAVDKLREYVTGLVLNEPNRIMDLIGGEIPPVSFLECMGAYNGIISLEGTTGRQMIQSTAQMEQSVSQTAERFPNSESNAPNAGDVIIQLPVPQLLEHYCRDESGSDKINCQVRQFVYSQGCNYEDMWEQDVIRNLKILAGSKPDLVSSEILNFSPSSFRKEVKQKLAASSTFWHTVEGKEGIAVQIKDAAAAFWKQPLHSLRDVLKKRGKKLDQKQKMLKELLKEQKNIPTKQKELTKRLENIASPIGKLPLSVEEALLYFPIVVALVFLMCACLYSEMGELRKQYYEVCLEQDKTDDFVTVDRVETIAPTWVGGKPGESNFLIGSLALLAPGFTIVGLLLVVGAGTKYGQLEFSYSALAYLGVLVVMVYAYWKIIESAKATQLGADSSDVS